MISSPFLYAAFTSLPYSIIWSYQLRPLLWENVVRYFKDFHQAIHTLSEDAHSTLQKSQSTFGVLYPRNRHEYRSDQRPRTVTGNLIVICYIRLVPLL